MARVVLLFVPVMDGATELAIDPSMSEVDGLAWRLKIALLDIFIGTHHTCA